jgi:hypothetical protein
MSGIKMTLRASWGRAAWAAPLAALAIAGCGAAAAKSKDPKTPFLAGLTSISTVGSTVPANGDINPYGIVQLSTTTGKLRAGDLLISNFNDKANNQGTGTTLVELTPAGKLSLFAKINPSALPGPLPGGVGLTTALSVLPGGYVVVGSLPTSNGKSATAKYGGLIVLDDQGKPVSTISGRNLQGPWDMTAITHGNVTTLFVANALNGGAAAGVHTIDNSTVVRIRVRSGVGEPPTVLSQTVIANGIPWRDDPNALVIGPTGVALSPDGTLYLADTLDNRIAAIPDALTRTTAAPDGGRTVSEGHDLIQPLGLTLAPGGDILTTNAGNGNIVETTPGGKQLLARTADTKTGAGSLFGLVVSASGHGIYFVDDGDNTVKLLR